MHNFIIGLPVFSNQHLFQLTQDKKGIFKVCSGAECKDAKSSCIVYATSFGLIVAVHSCSLDCKHYSSHHY
ncbi:hypothetical protein H5410_022199 [Solanum commersonii]|uniref:Uncharacterized protein n=1 Tax=Solanum commersonii TaxID=4109 RepID=A0A9J5ZIY2_SOLCO|nr:hypothetical protein H5410_022199 [Solanum commersonii]